jgi:hypothetical protein
MTELHVKSNRHWRQFRCRAEVPLKILMTQFDWMIPQAIEGDLEAIKAWRCGADESSDYWDGFILYKGFWYHTSNFMRTTLEGWDGSHHDSMSTGVLVKVHHDCERYMIGTFSS